jgi:hypothetical protein
VSWCACWSQPATRQSCRRCWHQRGTCHGGCCRCRGVLPCMCPEQATSCIAWSWDAWLIHNREQGTAHHHNALVSAEEQSGLSFTLTGTSMIWDTARRVWCCAAHLCRGSCLFAARIPSLSQDHQLLPCCSLAARHIFSILLAASLLQPCLPDKLTHARPFWCVISAALPPPHTDSLLTPLWRLSACLCLQRNPVMRPSAAEALEHPWLAVEGEANDMPLKVSACGTRIGGGGGVGRGGSHCPCC